MAAIIATARRLHPPVSQRPPPVDRDPPSRTAPQPVPLALRPSVQATPAMVATSIGMATGLVASDDPSGAAQTGNCSCGGRGCFARGDRPLEGCHLDRRKIDVIVGRVSIFSPFKNGASPVCPVSGIPLWINAYRPHRPKDAKSRPPVAGAVQP